MSRCMHPWPEKSGKAGSPASKIWGINGLFIAERECRGRRGIHSARFGARGVEGRGWGVGEVLPLYVRACLLEVGDEHGEDGPQRLVGFGHFF